MLGKEKVGQKMIKMRGKSNKRITERGGRRGPRGDIESELIVGYWGRQEELDQIDSVSSISDAPGEWPWWKVAGYSACTYQLLRRIQG